MKMDPPLLRAKFLCRYKRFLADVALPNGELLTVHCPNTGRMTRCLVEGSPCFLWDSNNPKRKYRYSLELVTTACGHLAGVNTLRANQLISEALLESRLPELQGYTQILSEQRYGAEKSRIDFLLRSENESCFIEVKSVTLALEHRCGFFPDAVSARASKHLRELIAVRRAGHRAVLVYCVQHTGIDSVAPASHVDPTYGQNLRAAVAAGVEVLAYRVVLSGYELIVGGRVSVVLE